MTKQVSTRRTILGRFLAATACAAPTLLKAKQVSRPMLVGWSAGGYWITDYVREYGTGNIAGLVFAGSHGGLMSAEINPALPDMSKAIGAALRAYPPDIPETLVRGEQFASRMSAHPPTELRVLAPRHPLA